MKNFLRYLITSLIGAAIVIAVVCGYKIWEMDNVVSQMALLSDGFFAAGGVIFAFGLLIFVSDRGVFDMLMFAGILFINLFRKDVNKRKYKDFKEYSDARAAKDKHSILYMIIVGGAYIVCAVIFLILFYSL